MEAAQHISSLLQQFRQHGWVHQTQDESWVWLPDLRYIKAATFFGDLTLQQLEQATRTMPSTTDDPGENWLSHWQTNGSEALEMTLDDILNQPPALTPSPVLLP